MGNSSSSYYQSIRHPKLEELNIATCYLCGKQLDGSTYPDHIIPNHLFSKADPNRPQLSVHNDCNSQKSKEDQWFVKQLQLSTAYDPEAYGEFSHFLDKAKNELGDAYIIGKNPRNLVLAKSIFEKGMWGLEIEHNGQRYAEFKLPPKNIKRFYSFIENMCRGLFVRNVLSSNPNQPEVIPAQYEYLKLKGKLDGFKTSIQTFVNGSISSLFGQSWGNKIMYFGSRVAETPNKGYIFVEFYRQFGVLAVFK